MNTTAVNAQTILGIIHAAEAVEPERYPEINVPAGGKRPVNPIYKAGGQIVRMSA